MRDGQLRFAYSDVQRELHDAEKLARRFLDRDSVGRLDAAADRLSFLRHQHNERTWGLPSDAPLRTRPSRGYEQGTRQGSHRLQAAIDSTWRLTPDGRNTFRVTGNVSTRVRLLDFDDGAELGRWRVELGAEGAPGCFFHTQIRGQAEDRAPPWPYSVPVPRLPSPFVSIPAVLIFVLGELFQTEWARHVDDSRAHRLAADQRRDWERRLRWELEAVQRHGLPWTGLKHALPHRDLFLRNAGPEVFDCD